MIAYGCRDKWMLINLGDIVEIFGKNKEKWKKWCLTRQVLRGSADACRCLGGVSPYRMQKVGKMLAGSVKGAYLCSVKHAERRWNGSGNTPESFTLTCGKYTRHCPEDIRLFASSDGKNYELIYCELGFNKRFNPNQGATTVCRIKADKQKPYKYYRFEGSGNNIDYSFAELTMNYKN